MIELNMQQKQKGQPVLPAARYLRIFQIFSR